MNPAPSPQPSNRAIFRARHRLGTKAAFDAVFANKIRKSCGPITVFVRPTDRNEHRLGLSVGRKVGNAVVRGRFKRMIREVFRLRRADLPAPSAGGHYDIVVTTGKHEPLEFETYARAFLQALEAAHRVCEKRAKQATDRATDRATQ